MRINCPHCGPRDSAEYTYYGDASRVRPSLTDTGVEHWHAYVHERDNVKGPMQEFWHHLHGCRQWLVVTRNTATHEIGAVRFAKSPVSGTAGA